MKKLSLYGIVLILLCFGIYKVRTRHTDNPYGTSEAGFTVKDTANVGRLFIATFDGATALVERTDSGWMLNHSYKAMPSMVRMILTTLAQQEALYPVNKNAVENSVKQLSTLGTKVEVYNRKNQVITKFYVGGAAPNNSGTVMMTEGASQPYVVHIQGFVGVLLNRFSAKEKDWRDRHVFAIAPDQIKSVSVEYADHPEHSFVVAHETGTAVVTGAKAGKPADLNLHNANLYLTYFANVNCEGYLNGTEGMDSLIRTGHRHSVIDIETTDGRHHRVESYWIAANKRSKNLVSKDMEVPDEYDSDRLYALMDGNKDTVMIQQFVFRPIFRKIGEFFQKGATPTY